MESNQIYFDDTSNVFLSACKVYMCGIGNGRGLVKVHLIGACRWQ